MDAPEGYPHRIEYAEVISYLSAADKIYQSGGMKWTLKVFDYCKENVISPDDLALIIEYAVQNGHLENSKGLNAIISAKRSSQDTAPIKISDIPHRSLDPPV